MANLDPSASGLPTRVVEATAVDFKLLSEADPEAADFYRLCDRLGAGAEAL